ncbi:MAG TPA: hypothetical protein VGU73_04880 [Acidimicrobiia bacterium]|nr:hypothetical protein [Acidimicrobiia bacterium]
MRGGFALLFASALLVAAPPAAATTTARESRVLLPVVGCPARAGVAGLSTPPIPTQLGAAVRAGVASRLRFYSDGFMVVLAPTGWTCTGLEAADGGQSISVFPAGQTDPLAAATTSADAAAVTARFDYTGHGPGAQLVCGLFPSSAAARLAAATGGCTTVPAREVVRRPSRDVATFVDPPGVSGTGEPSGGANAASGAVFFPQPVRPSPSVNVAKVTCTVPRALVSLCPLIVGDLVGRARLRPRV